MNPTFQRQDHRHIRLFAFILSMILHYFLAQHLEFTHHPIPPTITHTDPAFQINLFDEPPPPAQAIAPPTPHSTPTDTTPNTNPQTTISTTQSDKLPEPPHSITPPHYQQPQPQTHPQQLRAKKKISASSSRKRSYHASPTPRHKQPSSPLYQATQQSVQSWSEFDTYKSSQETPRSLDRIDIIYRAYYSKVLRTIHQHWISHYQFIQKDLPARYHHPTHAAIIRYRFNTQGKITNIHILQSCGNEEIDQDILMCIKYIEPYPLIPQSLGIQQFEAISYCSIEIKKDSRQGHHRILTWRG